MSPIQGRSHTRYLPLLLRHAFGGENARKTLTFRRVGGEGGSLLNTIPPSPMPARISRGSTCAFATSPLAPLVRVFRSLAAVSGSFFAMALEKASLGANYSRAVPRGRPLLRPLAQRCRGLLRTSVPAEQGAQSDQAHLGCGVATMRDPSNPQTGAHGPRRRRQSQQRRQMRLKRRTDGWGGAASVFAAANTPGTPTT